MRKDGDKRKKYQAKKEEIGLGKTGNVTYAGR